MRGRDATFTGMLLTTWELRTGIEKKRGSKLTKLPWNSLKPAIACLATIAFVLAASVSPKAQTVSPSVSTLAPAASSSQSTTTIIQVPQIPSSDPFLGSVPSGKKTDGVLPLSMEEALNRGLKYNLGVVLGNQDIRSARGARLRALSDLLPRLTTRTAESVEQINLAAFGIPAPAGTPPIVGPFRVFDARASLGQPIFDLHAWNNTRAGSENIRAAEFNFRDARETVVLVVADLYLESLAAQARVESAQAQFATAKAVYDQSVDLRNSGVAAGIDVLRAQVQMQSRRQRVLSSQNDLEKQKLNVGRAIGLPPGQLFALTDRMPQAPPKIVSVDEALADAYHNRADYMRAQSLVRSTSLAKEAALGQALPSLRFDGDYGAIGRSPASSHGTFSATVALQVPVFQGGRVRGEVEQAQALLDQRRAEVEDLRGRIDAEVRSAYLDVQSAAQQLEVARTTVDLANQQLTESRDRFAAGVAGSLEVTQSQEAVASANDDFISSLYSFNVSQASLARAAGAAEKSVKQFLGRR
jgi:outer membrane protein TolC